MLQTILNSIPQDRDFPERTYRLSWLRAALDGTLYDGLPYEFHTERNDVSGEYIPLRNRRPSVQYGLCSTVVDDSVALLFSEAHFPTVQCADKATKDAIADLIKEARLDDVMVDAAKRGSVGSVAILLRVLDSRPFFSVLTTEYLTPAYKATAPDTLESVTERYKLRGRDLREAGYTVADEDLEAQFWFQRTWDVNAETWFVPLPVSKAAEGKQAKIDTQRTPEPHKLGFVPIVWIKNLPGGDEIDGACTFAAAIKNSIEIDYQLSQAGRGLKYSSDPTLLIKEPTMADGDMVRGGGNAIITSQDGDAKLLEIGGTASAAVIEYVRTLRELALEAVHGNRANADKLSAAQSGRALELMNQGLIWLADRLRASYGEHGLLPLLRMVVKASQRIPLTIMNQEGVTLNARERLTLVWPRWYQPTAEDRQADANTLVALRSGGLISRETAIQALASDYDIEDVAAEVALIAADEAAQDARMAKQAAQVKATENAD